MKSLLLSLCVVALIHNKSFSQNDLQNGLLAYYPFSGNTNDVSGNNNNGATNGAILTSDRFGNVDNAYAFDGIDDHIEISAAILQNSSYTFSLWAKPTVIPSSGSYTYTLSLGGTKDQSMDLSNNANGVYGWVSGGYNVGAAPTISFVSVGSLPTINNWYHCVVTRNNTSMKLYVDGKLIGTSSTGGQDASYGTSVKAIIGARCNVSQFFKGAIDDVRIYNRVLNDCEISMLYGEGGFGRIVEFPFSGNSNDVSGNGNNGTVNGASLTSDRFGNSNSAYNFDGVDDYIEFSSSTVKNNSYTFSLWAKAAFLPGDGSYVYTLSLGGTEADQSMDLSNNANTTTGWVSGGYNLGNNPIVSYVSVGSLPSPDTWYHCVVTRDNTSMKLYVNGELIGASSTGSQNANYGTGVKAIIGARCTISQFFHGAIDDVKIYNRALSQCEVEDLYSTGQVLSTTMPHKNKTLMLYPNPTADKVSVDLTDIHGPIGVTLLDYLGHAIYEQKAVGGAVKELDLSANTPGIYMIQISAAEGVYCQKIILK